jgi:hypothetical protein
MHFQGGDGSVVSNLSPLARIHLATCEKVIQQWDIRHRHHGTWLMVRQSFASALLLLAACKAGLSEVAIEQCEFSVKATLSTIQFWENEAPDLKASRLILQKIIDDLALWT